MIRIRKADGSSVEVIENGTFVELVNDVDKTTMLVFAQVHPGMILQINPGSSDAARFEGLFAKQGVVFSKTMTLRQST